MNGVILFLTMAAVATLVASDCHICKNCQPVCFMDDLMSGACSLNGWGSYANKTCSCGSKEGLAVFVAEEYQGCAEDDSSSSSSSSSSESVHVNVITN